MFLSAAIIVSSFILMICLYHRAIRFKELSDPVMKTVPWIYFFFVILMVCDLSSGGDLARRLPLDISLCLLPLIVLTSSVLDQETAVKAARLCSFMMPAMSVFCLMCAFGIVRPFSVNVIHFLVIVIAVAMAVLYLASLWLRIRDVKAVMRAGTVWLSLTLAVDSIYVVAAMIDILLYVALDHLCPGSMWPSLILTVFLSLEILAIGLRLAFDSVFVFMRRQERRIVESMKISHVEVAGEGAREDDHYRDVYERVVAYFEEARPYLNGELTINDVVKVVFTNKLYISRAISQYTGRNFCQFVNYYRVAYSVTLFRKNPELKLVELANASGFNSVVSFNMAFRLFMSESPGDWCRKERLLLLKGKNKLWNR